MDEARQSDGAAAQRPARVRAVSLLSGGLDSRLAVCVLREQGIDVEAIAFDSPFFRTRSAVDAAALLGVRLHVLDFTADILALLDDPPHGFGTCMNPCIDCHARMLRRAGEFAAANGFHVVSTGEVMGQRPMSQNRNMLLFVARASGFADIIVRPLSARLLPETAVERRGWVDRGRLLAIQGRGRKEQVRLAAHYGVRDYPQPAGGCLLTEPLFARRLGDLKAHEGLANPRDIALLKIGRHFRLGERLRLVVGRDERENGEVERLAAPQETLIRVESHPGPQALLLGEAGEAQVAFAARICLRYSDCAAGAVGTASVRAGGEWRRLDLAPAPPAEADAMRL